MLALYTLIWKRFLACQMAPARYDQTSILVAADKHELKAVGSIMRFPGFITIYVESEDENAEAADDSATLPDLKAGDTLKLLELLPKQHFTQPPPRYTEATLVKALEENGVGRPSTYAAIISTIQDKEYVRLEQRRFFPTDLGLIVNDLLVDHFPAVIDVEFTASMEGRLDEVESGAKEWVGVLRDFYGPFKETLERAKEEMKSLKRSAVPTDLKCPLCGGSMVIKWGKNGEFLACENFPDCKHTSDFTREADGKVVPVIAPAPEESTEVCEKCGKAMVYKNGRFGRFLACSGYPECKNVRAISTGVPCPEPGCDGELVQKVSKRGKVFYSCNRYPKCTFATWDKPVNRPCLLCDSPYLVEKESKKEGRQIKCPVKGCHYKETLEPESGE